MPQRSPWEYWVVRSDMVPILTVFRRTKTLLAAEREQRYAKRNWPDMILAIYKVRRVDKEGKK